MRTPLHWKRSLAIPIVALLLVIAVGMMLVGYFINDRVFFTALEERERDKANSIRFATRSIIDAEVRKLSTLSGILKTDDGLESALAHHQRNGGDIRPLKSAMDDLFLRVDTQIFVVTDPDGVVLYRANDPLKRGDQHRVWGFEEAITGTDVIAASEGPRGWAVRALAPIRTGNRVAGVLILGTRLDNTFAGMISRETGARISFANLKGVISGNTPSNPWPPDPSLIRYSLLEHFPIFRMNLERDKATQYAPIKVVDETFCLIIETDMGIVHALLHRNRLKLAKTGALLLAGVLLLGITATYLLVRPLKKLQRESREVVREFTGADLPLDTDGNEIHALESAFRRMVEAIRTHISAREKAESELRKSGEQLRQGQKMEAIGRLAGGVAHDFNNLLTVINGYSEVVLRRLGEDEPARREVGEIHKAGERASALTRQLLAFSRKQVLKAKPIALNENVSGMAAMLRHLLGENIRLATTLDPHLWTVVADTGQVEQVIMNLAVNARDAMPTGGTITISTSNVAVVAPEERDGYVLPAGRYVLLEIADTGCGMDAETKASMFEPFFTTKELGKGTGLGLASVYGIVKQSGGYIGVRSAKGVGTSFEIHFPIAEHSDEATQEKPAPETESGKSVRKGENILLVEDEEMVRELVLEGLRRDGYSVLAASNAMEMLSALERRSRPIDLLLTDLMMPGMNGMELARRLMPLHPGMKVLLMSGYSEEEIGKFVQNEPGTVFLQKPVTPSLISRKVREVFDMQSG